MCIRPCRLGWDKPQTLGKGHRGLERPNQTLTGCGQRYESPPFSPMRALVTFEGPSLWKETDPGWRPCSGQGGASVAATGLDHHVAVFAQDDVVAAVIVEHRGGAQLGGRTARLGNRVRLHQVHLAGEGRQAEA